MAKLSFLNQLDESQLEYARRIGEKAKEMGIPPSLAISIAYHESGLNPARERGKDGEYGIMQVMPSTGKDMGYTNQDLADPDKNIEAGLKYLKQNLDAFGGDARLATIAYNKGPNHKFFYGGELPKVTEDYLRAMKGYGAYGAAQATGAAPSATAPSAIAPIKTVPAEAASAATTPSAAAFADGELQLVDAPPPRKPSIDNSGASPGERLIFGLGGAGVGTAITGANAFMDNRDSAAATRAAAEESARIRVRRDEANARTALLREQQAAQRLADMQAATAGSIPTPGQAPGTPPGGLTGGSGPTQQSVRIQQGTTGDLGTTGRQRSNFLNDTSRIAASQKIAYNNADILKTLGLADQSGAEFFVKQSGMTATPSGVLFPMSAPAQTAGPRSPQPFQTRSGPQARLNIPPLQGPPSTAQAIPSVLAGALPDDVSLRPPPVKSGLGVVSDLFSSMMRPLEPAANAAGRALKPLLGPLGGLSFGLDSAEIAHEMSKPVDQRSVGKIGLKGLSAASGALSMFPGPQQRITVPTAIGSSALYEILYNEELKNYMRKKLGIDPQSIEPQVVP